MKDEETGKPRMAVDFDKLRQFLGDNTVPDRAERYEFNWVGKQEAAEDKITVEATEPKIHQWVCDNQFSMGQLMNCLRIAVIGISQGPSIFAISEFIGKEETLARVDRAIAMLGEGK